jgi:aerobic carbon-monoxide dehydrogenase large subunit
MATASPIGHGRMLRKEDPRFVRGRGLFCDDVQLPGDAAPGHPPVAGRARAHHADRHDRGRAHPKVKAVLTGADLAERGLAWMPTLAGDVQPVLATDKVRFQGQEVAAVVTEDRYAARDALELIDVDYEILDPVVDVRRALDPDAPSSATTSTARPTTTASTGRPATRPRPTRRSPDADVVVAQDLVYPRVHPAPLETCGCRRRLRPHLSGKLTVWSTSQAPHAHRTIYAVVAGLPEHRIRVISPDVGGGFGNKVPIYPGYVCAIVASMVTGRPVKWMEDRTENLLSTCFARDYVMHGEIAATADGRILAIRADVLADHGAFNGTAAPAKYPAGFFGVFTGSYDLEAAHCTMTAVHTNKAPGGVAYSCSFRITEAVYLVERLVDCLAREIGHRPGGAADAQLHPTRAVPLHLQDRMGLRLRRVRPGDGGGGGIAGYDDLRREQADRSGRAVS